MKNMAAGSRGGDPAAGLSVLAAHRPNVPLAARWSLATSFGGYPPLDPLGTGGRPCSPQPRTRLTPAPGSMGKSRASWGKAAPEEQASHAFACGQVRPSVIVPRVRCCVPPASPTPRSRYLPPARADRVAGWCNLRAMSCVAPRHRWRRRAPHHQPLAWAE